MNPWPLAGRAQLRSTAAQPTCLLVAQCPCLARPLTLACSCEPNLDVTFPQNNALVALVASRDIAAREQLTISYTDTGLGLQQRRAALHFGYGFTCGCPRCVEEAAAEQ